MTAGCAAPPAPLRIEVVREPSALDSLRPAWERLDARCPPASPFHRSTFQLPWLHYLAATRRLHVLLAWSGEELAAVLPLLGDDVRRGPVRAGRLSLPTHGRGVPRMDARLDATRAPEAARALLQAWRATARPWTFLSLRHLDGDSRLLRVLPAACRALGLTCLTVPARKEAYVPLTADTWAAHLRRLPKKHRATLNAAFQRVDRRDGWRFDDCWPAPAEVDELLSGYHRMVAGSWKREEVGDGALMTFRAEAARGFARTGDLHLVRLLDGAGATAAAVLSFRAGRVLAASIMAYRDDCPIRSAGSATLACAIRAAYACGLAEVDFASAAPHLTRWLPMYRPTYDVYVLRNAGAALAFQLALRVTRTPR